MPPPPVNVAKTAVAELLRLPVNEQALAKRSLQILSEAFGQPRKHAGIGIRKLKGAVFECRINKSIRAIFVWRNGSIWVETVGNHEDVKRFLKSKKSKT